MNRITDFLEEATGLEGAELDDFLSSPEGGYHFDGQEMLAENIAAWRERKLQTEPAGAAGPSRPAAPVEEAER
jgi:hypothetical protein